MVTITLELPEAVERKARDAGLLTTEMITAWIEGELERKRAEAGARLLETMDTVSAHFRAQYPSLSEEEALAMIDQWIDEAGDSPDNEADST